jgi:CBS domain containing-hemolysin-like protein
MNDDIPQDPAEGSATGVARLIDRVRGLVRGRKGDSTLREAIDEMIEEGEVSPAAIGSEERTLLANIFKLRGLTAWDVMVPRADIVAVDETVALAELVRVMSREAHSRLPVYRGTLDDATGIVHMKDLLRHWGEQEVPLADIVRPVLFVAPSMRVLDLLLEMRRSRVHLALVVDEYGGVDGLVTIEDLVEEIVGEIEDEHDVEEGPRLAELPDGAYLADARLDADAFEEKFGRVFAEGERPADVDTLGGLVTAFAGRLPSRGEVITHPAGLEFEVVDADPRRLKRLKVRRVKPVLPPSGADDGTG